MTETENKKSIKLILVGSGGVGKTSLVTKFYNQHFEAQTLPTVAPAFCSANIPLKNGLTVELQIWDTAGQEQYQAICQMFYHESNIAFVCFDNSSADTVEQWVLRVRSQVPNCLIFLVSTKVDLLSSEELLQLKKDGKEMVSKYKAEAHFMTSSKTGQEVSNLFYEAANFVDKIQGMPAPTEKLVPLEKKERSGCNC